NLRHFGRARSLDRHRIPLCYGRQRKVKDAIMLVDILINASPDGDADPAVNCGLSLAKSLNAHATGVVLGVEPIVPVTYFAAAPVELVNKLRGAAEEAANAAAARFTKAANAAGVDSDSF